MRRVDSNVLSSTSSPYSLLGILAEQAPRKACIITARPFDYTRLKLTRTQLKRVVEQCRLNCHIHNQVGFLMIPLVDSVSRTMKPPYVLFLSAEICMASYLGCLDHRFTGRNPAEEETSYFQLTDCSQ